MRILWTELAEQDLKQIEIFIVKDDPVAAITMVITIHKTVYEVLSKFSQAGRRGRQPDTLELVIPKTSYFVVYDIRDNAIRVLTVIHQARCWPDQC